MYHRVLNHIAVILFSCASLLVKAQHYQAVYGSSLAGGSLGVSNNPASIVHIPFAWDVTLFSFQDQHTTNAFVINKASLMNLKNAEIASVNGNRKRALLGNQDVHLLNARIHLDSRQSIAFGVNLRSAFSVGTSGVNWQDTITRLYSFLDNNKNQLPLSANLRAIGWAEIFGSYARTLIDNGSSILNAGVTLSLNRGLGGAYLNASNLNYFPSFNQGRQEFNLATGELQFGYSANFDDNNTGTQLQQVVKRSLAGFSASFGIEYIIPGMEGESAYDYEWKIGVSAMDLGFSTYQYSNNSRFAVLDKDNISDSMIENSFDDVGSIEDVNDSLANLAGFVSMPAGIFHIAHPARLIINADRRLQENLFVNAQLTIPLGSLLPDRYLYVRDMNLLAVTARYETRGLGLYLPVTFNMQKQLWVGGAFRAGPLLMGIHNWANLFGKNKIQRGGLYLALTFRPGKKRDGQGFTSRDSAPRLSRKERRLLECPRY
jgi:hypothetical protein